MTEDPAPEIKGKPSFSGVIIGILVCLVLGTAAYLTAEIPFISETLRWSPLLVVILLGIAVASVIRIPDAARAGIVFCQKPLLRFAVAFLGFRLSWDHFVELGWQSGVVILGATAVGVTVGWLLGAKVLGNERLGMLLGAGGGICGASAIVAADSVVHGTEDEVAMSLGVITLLGTVGIFLYPLIQNGIALDAVAFGVWSGATLHETAHSVAAGSYVGDFGLDAATIAKIGRVALLAPLVVIMSMFVRKRHMGGDDKVPILPLFVVAFIAFAAWNSLPEGFRLPESALSAIQVVTLFLLTVGMAGVGLATDLRKIAKAGLPVLAVGAVQWVALSVTGLLLILWLL